MSQRNKIEQLFAETSVVKEESSEKKYEDAPFGKYQATVWSIATTVPDNPEKSPYCMWKFRVAAGPHKDKFITKFNSFRTKGNMEWWLRELQMFDIEKPKAWHVEDWSHEERAKVTGKLVEVDYKKQANSDYTEVYITQVKRPIEKKDPPMWDSHTAPDIVKDANAQPDRPKVYNDDDIPF
tara:strand:+ start:2429 stop:2971 length:543 start_codon:yes stop_codon:yes gene_type:complete